MTAGEKEKGPKPLSSRQFDGSTLHPPVVSPPVQTNLLTRNAIPSRGIPMWKQYAKAIAPFAASLVAAGVQWALTGQYDANEIHTNVAGLVSALLVYLVPNKPAA